MILEVKSKGAAVVTLNLILKNR